ncbi:hypothetical protein D4764_09G0010490 [Takifugu flavidus]|uniref:Uncharacterized protein n=1 Tax=Takifugu flavidus TaxID=433684 RepID=A0A5C6MMK5_9TELE|nr:hypothetical protein D4764_09G0010490 [Takifugu flavidus]
MVDQALLTGGREHTRNTRAALQGCRAHEGHEGTGNRGGPPGETNLERPPGDTTQEQPSRAQGTRAALQETRSWSGPPVDAEQQHTTRETNRQPRDHQTH